MDDAEAAADRARSLLGMKSPPDVEVILSAEQADREAALKAMISGRTYRLAQVGAWEAMTAANPDGDGWDPEVMLAWLTTAAGTWGHDIAQSQIDRAVEAVRSDPEGWESSLAAALVGWAAMAPVFAQSIATESRGFGGQDAAGASGLTTKMWVTGGTNPRISHAAQNGETVNLGDVFSNGLRWPGDRGGSAEETVNCRCRLTYSREG